MMFRTMRAAAQPGIQFKTGMGIADSLRIGDVLVKNVVFQVMPDSILLHCAYKIPAKHNYRFPGYRAIAGGTHFPQSGIATIPLLTPAKSDLHNFALDGLDPVIALKSG